MSSSGEWVGYRTNCEKARAVSSVAWEEKDACRVIFSSLSHVSSIKVPHAYVLTHTYRGLRRGSTNEEEVVIELQRPENVLQL